MRLYDYDSETHRPIRHDEIGTLEEGTKVYYKFENILFPAEVTSGSIKNVRFKIWIDPTNLEDVAIVSYSKNTGKKWGENTTIDEEIFLRK